MSLVRVRLRSRRSNEPLPRDLSVLVSTAISPRL
jgi:hypothetical protein